MILKTHGLEKYGWRADRLKYSRFRRALAGEPESGSHAPNGLLLGESQSPRSPPADRGGCKRKKEQMLQLQPTALELSVIEPWVTFDRKLL